MELYVAEKNFDFSKVNAGTYEFIAWKTNPNEKNSPM